MFNSFVEWLNSTHIAFQSAEVSKAFLVFLLFSLIGWLCEVAYVGIFFEHKFVNRGFLFGPVCPVYGTGGILILSLPQQLQNPVWVLYLAGVFFCSFVEYAVGFGLEKNLPHKMVGLFRPDDYRKRTHHSTSPSRPRLP